MESAREVTEGSRGIIIILIQAKADGDFFQDGTDGGWWIHLKIHLQYFRIFTPMFNSGVGLYLVFILLLACFVITVL